MKRIMNILLIGLTIIVAIVLINYKFGGTSLKKDLINLARPDIHRKPKILVDNDKIILVNNLKLEYLKKAIQQYCNLNNQIEYGTLPSVIEDSNRYVIYFPYDTDFENFCYFINYIQYAHELSLEPDYKPDIKAWCTLSEHSWTNNEMIGKKAILFIPPWDEECDNVYLTTQDDNGYKMGFAIGHNCQKLEKPASPFIDNNIILENLKNKQVITFE